MQLLSSNSLNFIDIILGLYRAAIGQSGSFLNTWAYTSSTKDTAFELGRELNFTGNTSEDLKKFLKIQSAVDIKIAATNVYSNNAVRLNTTNLLNNNLKFRLKGFCLPLKLITLTHS